jgi:hypothetical protein
VEVDGDAMSRHVHKATDQAFDVIAWLHAYTSREHLLMSQISVTVSTDVNECTVLSNLLNYSLELIS